MNRVETEILSLAGRLPAAEEGQRRGSLRLELHHPWHSLHGSAVGLLAVLHLRTAQQRPWLEEHQSDSLRRQRAR